jgi:hypothetical protein
VQELSKRTPVLSIQGESGPAATRGEDPEWDVFICHASEDKATVVEPLVASLARRGLRVWYDRATLTIGDSLRRSIDEGVARSRFGIVIISPAFLAKGWTQWELDGLVQREVGEGKVILPVWHQVDKTVVQRYSPSLANRLAGSTNKGIEALAEELLEAINRGGRNVSPPLSGGTEPVASDAVEEKWVDLEYPKDSGLLARLETEGYEVRWCADRSLSRRVDLEGWEVVREGVDGGRRVIFRLRDRPDNQTLIRRRRV